MGKISVYKFDLGNTDSNSVELFVKEYMESIGLVYNSEHNMYETVEPGRKNDVKNAAATAASTLLTGKTTVYYSLGKGLGYEISNNQLLIKACLINYKMKGMRQPVQTWFYKELKKDLFKKLEEKGLKLVGKKTEKVNDPDGNAAQRKAFILCGVILLFMILMVAFV